MPPRILRDILVIDSSMLARNMYELLFSAQNRFRVRFGDEYASLFKKSRRMRPDLLVLNSHVLPKGTPISFPTPAILITSRGRTDIKEQTAGVKNVVLIEKPFYPYDLISVANRLIAQNQLKAKGRGRPIGRRVKKSG